MLTEKARQLVLNSSRSFAFLTNPVTRDLEVVRLDDSLLATEDLQLAIVQRRLCYAATLGIVDGEPCVVLHRAFDERTTLALARAVAVFVMMACDEPEPRPDDFENFMHELYKPRPEA